MKLHEVLKSVYPFVLKPRGDDGDWSGRFKTDSGELVSVGFVLRRSYNMYEIEFTRAGSYALSGKGDALKIFGTIMAITDQFIAEQKPAGFFFSSWKGEGSRGSLYDRLVKRYTATSEYVDVTDELDRLQDERTREWFATKLADDRDTDELKLIVRRELLK